MAFLLRGRRGSEWAIGGHVAGEAFSLIDPPTLRMIDLPLSALGATARISAIGPGDDGVPVDADLTVAGNALRPLTPVGLRAVRLADGTVRIGWTRRSRAGWAWLDGGDAPIGEDGERYRLVIVPATGITRTIELISPGFDYDPGAQSADGVGPTTALTFNLVQIGTRALSRPATFTL